MPSQHAAQKSNNQQKTRQIAGFFAFQDGLFRSTSTAIPIYDPPLFFCRDVAHFLARSQRKTPATKMLCNFCGNRDIHRRD